MMLVAAGSFVACHKDAPAPKPKPVVIKKSPAELKQLADSATQSLEGLKPLLGALNAKFTSLHQQFDPLPPDLPGDFGIVRSRFYSADEGVGRMNAKIPWLASQLDAAIKAGDGAQLEEISNSIARTYNDVPQVDQIATELFHEVMHYTRVAEHYQADKKAMCDSDKSSTTALTAADVGKKLSAH
jgi:hypothetical protein